jgi:hypothetical protein
MFGKIVLKLCVIVIGVNQEYVKTAKILNIAREAQCTFGTKNKTVL